MKYEAKVEVAPGITMTFVGDTQLEFEEDIRAGCLFAERNKFNQVSMMRNEDAMRSMQNLGSDLRKAFGDRSFHLFVTPKCETYEKIYDESKHKFTDDAGLVHDTEPKPEEKPVAKHTKSEEGTVHLSPDMTTKELAAAIGKGGMKTIDLDDVDAIRELLAKAKKEVAESKD